MKIAFLTTQEVTGSTVVGRVLPLARELAKEHEVTVLVHKSSSTNPKTPLKTSDVDVQCLTFGRDPFIRTASGKRRLKGITLVGRLKLNAALAAVELFRIKPDVIVITKSLPESVLAAWFAKLIFLPKATFILDVDDFELTANELSSPLQRAAVHWAQRAGAHIAQHIVAATPFLQDYFMQLAPSKSVSMIPTGIHDAINVGLFTGPPTLLYIGSVSGSSGHRVDMLPDILEQVRRHVPDTVLVIAGGGDDQAKLKILFAERGLTDAVVWAGHFSLEDIPSLLSRVHVILDPIDSSITNRAKSSFRVMIAAAAAMPVVTSNIGIRSQLVPAESHSQFFADPSNPESYAEKAVKLLRAPLAPSARDALKQHGIRYTWKVLARQYIAILK